MVNSEKKQIRYLRLYGEGDFDCGICGVNSRDIYIDQVRSKQNENTFVYCKECYEVRQKLEKMADELNSRGLIK